MIRGSDMKKYINPDVQVLTLSANGLMADRNVIYASGEQGAIDYVNDVGISTIDFGQLK